MRWIFRILSVVAVLVGLAFVTRSLIPSDRIAALAASEFSRLTGRSLTIGGAVAPALWPVIGVRTGAITLSNADWSQAGPMIRADSLFIGLDLPALLGGSLRITRLDLTAPEILLERAGDGAVNWVFGGPAAGAGGAAPPVTLLSARLQGGRITFVDHASGRRSVLSDLAAVLRMPQAGGGAELSLAGRLSDGAAGRDLTLAAHLDDLPKALGGTATALSATASLGAARLGFDGRAALRPFAAKGAVDADLSDLSDIAALLGIAPPALPAGWGAGSVTLRGDLTVTAAHSLHLRGAVLTLDGRPIRGDADILTAGPPGAVSQAARPRIVAQVTAGVLDFAAPTGPPAPPAPASGWPGAPLDTAPLTLVDADIGFAAQGMTLGPLHLGAVNGRLAIDSARAVLSLAEVAAYDGALSGTLVADARGGLSVSADLALRGVALRPLLADLGAPSRLVAKGDMTLALAGGGGSVAALVQDLSGSLRLSLGPGRIEGVDLAALLATLDPARAPAGGATAFDSLQAGFTVAGGQMTGDDLRLDGPLVTATGAGRIGLASRDIDYRLHPVALTGADGTGGLGVPVWITGPWADPQLGLDLGALADDRLGARAAALQDEARRKAAADPGAAGGEDPQDAAKRTLDEALQRQIDATLNDLLGGG